MAFWNSLVKWVLYYMIYATIWGSIIVNIKTLGKNQIIELKEKLKINDKTLYTWCKFSEKCIDRRNNIINKKFRDIFSEIYVWLIFGLFSYVRQS